MVDFDHRWWIFPQAGLPVGFYLRKKETGHAGGRAVLCWARIWPCWARWAIWLCLARCAVLGADLAVLGALGDLALLGALCCVGRGFGRAGRAGRFGSAWRARLGWARIWPCWARWAGLGVGFGSGGRAGLGWARWAGGAWVWLCWARCAMLGADLAVLGALRWAGLGADLALLGALGWVGFGRAGRVGLGWACGSGGCAGLGWAWGLAVLGALLGWVGFGFGGCAVLCWVRIWLSVYGLPCTCLLHVFLMSLSLSSCVSQMVSWGLSKTKPGIREWNVVLSNSVFEKCDVKRTKWKRKERNGSSGNQHSLKRTA